MAEEYRGFAVVDQEFKVVFSSGLAANSLITAELVRKLKGAGERALPSVFAIEQFSQPVVVMSVRSQGATLFAVNASDRADPLFELIVTVPFAADILRYFLTNPYEAITVVDDQGLISYLSPVHEAFFKIPHGSAVGRPVREVIENTQLDRVIRTGRAQIGYTQEMRGQTRVVSRTPIHDPNGKIVGAIGQVMFKSPDELATLNNEIMRLRHEVSLYKRELTTSGLQSHGLDEIVGRSDAILQLKKQIARVAALDVPVLIVGESGVGKDLVAQGIHALSARANKQMVIVNAAALPENLVESELFGYEPGSFTGANRKGKRGKFEQANESSLFLDEIGDMPLETQAKLLRTLQDGSFVRVGSEMSQRADFRLIAASNRDFKQMLSDGTFRLDLFYRISAVTLRVPPLRERTEDIELLVNAELQKFASRNSTSPKSVSPQALEYLKRMPWPGNVRQLQHVVTRAAIFSDEDIIDIQDFEAMNDDFPGSSIARGEADWMTTSKVAINPLESVRVHEVKQSLEADMIRQALVQFKGNKKRVAQHLGISRSYLYKRLALMQTDESPEFQP